MTSSTIAAASVAVICLLICPMSAQPDSTSQVKQELNDRLNEWLEFYKNGDFKGLCNELYAEDCVVYLLDATVARGREECARGWEAIAENDYQYSGYFDNLILRDVIVTSADYVIETGVANNTVDQYEKWIGVWKRIRGKLYVIHNISNMNTPYKAPTLLEEITGRRNELSYYFNSGSFESVCNMYTPDCWIAPQGAPPVSGRDGCEKLLVKEAISGVAIISRVPEQDEIYDIGDEYILNHGAWITYDEAGGELDRVKDMYIWKRMDDGEFYVYFEMVNSDIHF